jgi:sporulation protein YlmC with PRC-barrel domain
LADILSWDKAIEREIKTIDGKKVGKIRAVTIDYKVN